MTNLLTFAGKPLGSLASLRDNLSHSHGLDFVAGYVLRQTQREGVWLWHDEAKTACGEDVEVFEGAGSYGALLERKYALGHLGANYFVADTVYTCGCRS